MTTEFNLGDYVQAKEITRGGLYMVAGFSKCIVEQIIILKGHPVSYQLYCPKKRN